MFWRKSRKESSSRIDQLKVDTAMLCWDEGRMPGSEGHWLAGTYVCDRMEELGLKPYAVEDFKLDYQVDDECFCNVVGVVEGRDRSVKPVLIGAHYDSVAPFQCADDNAAAVAIALAVAESLMAEPPSRDVVIAIFDAEEPPYFHSEAMGSVRFYEDQMDERGVHAALIMDLVGHDVVIPSEFVPSLNSVVSMMPGSEGRFDMPLPIIRDLLFVTGAESNIGMLEAFEKAGYPDNLGLANALNEYVGDMSDHMIFRMNDVPFLFFSCGHWPHYHMDTDTVDRLNFDKMARIADYLVRLTRAISDTSFADQPGEGDFTLSMELTHFKKAFGVLYKPMIHLFGFSVIETREQLTDFVQQLRESTGL